jgi:hypothetical protein
VALPAPSHVRRSVRRRTHRRRPLGGWTVAAGPLRRRSCRGSVHLATGHLAAAPLRAANPSGVGAGSRRRRGGRRRDARRRHGRLDALPGPRRRGDCRRRRSLDRRSLGLDGCRRRGRCDFWRGRHDSLDGPLRLPRRRLDHGSHRQERQRVDVTLVLSRHPQAEVDKRLRQVDHAARADGPDDGALGHARPAPDADRPEVHERRGVAERRLDRDGLPAGRHRAGERDDTFGRRKHIASAWSPEVDAAVLPGGVRVRTVEGEGTKHRPVDGPGPGLRSGCRQDERAERDDSDSPDHEASLLPGLRTARPYQGRGLVVNTGYKVRR